MIQFNLLPDVKLEFIKARRTKHVVTLVCSCLIIGSLVIFVLLFTVVNVLQHKRLNDLNNHIAKDTAVLKAIPDLNKVLTVQNQLNSLTALHEQSPATSRLFDYLAQLTPAQASVSDIKLDYAAQTLAISGTANNLTTVNEYVDTLKFTTYTVSGSNSSPKAFSAVVLSSFSVSGDNGATSYSISMKFDPVIFDNTKTVTLVVPHIISTRSETEKPTDLFQKINTGTQ